jgi:hypothetical protein
MRYSTPCRVTSHQLIYRRLKDYLCSSLWVTYLAVFHDLLFLSLSVMSPLLNVFSGEYVFHTLATPRLNGGVGTPSASVE